MHLPAPHSHLEAAPSPIQVEQGFQHKMCLLEPDKEKVENMRELIDTEKNFLSRTHWCKHKDQQLINGTWWN